MKSVENLLSEIWPEWHPENQIGAGAYGEVYEAVREDVAGRSLSAIKIIKLRPDSLRSQFSGEAEARAEFDRLMKRFSREIRVMQSLKGQTNLVNIEDYSITEEQGTCYILIRMELLTPLLVDLDIHDYGEERLIRMGIDLCRGLEACGREQIVHRDIRPENIFINRNGDFKLGDFGMARTLDMTREAMTSLDYGQLERFAAPEMKSGQLHEAGFEEAVRADIYSLGMVLYWIANGQKFPFLPEKQLFSGRDREEAECRRLQGEALPPLDSVSPGLQQVILRACAFDSRRRFDSPRAFREALEALQAGKMPEPERPRKPKGPGRMKRAWLWVVAAVLCLGAVGAGLWLANRPEKAPEPAAAETEAEEEITSLRFIHVFYPKVYVIGQPFAFSGRVVSNADLTEVTIHLYTTEKAYTAHMELPAGTREFDMKNAGDEIFRELDEGRYWFELIGADAAGRRIGFSHFCTASYTEKEHTLYETNRTWSRPELKGSLVCGGHTYEVYRMDGGGWHTGHTFAQGKGGHLVTFGDAEEFSMITSYCLGLGVRYLNVGLEYTGDGWRWVDGTEYDGIAWAPDTLEDHQYRYQPVGGIVYSSSQQWYLGKATEYEMNYFIVEYEESLH